MCDVLGCTNLTYPTTHTCIHIHTHAYTHPPTPTHPHTQSVESVVRKRAYKQRTLTTIGWFLSDKYQLDISLYALLLPATGPKKVGVHVTTGKAVRTVTSKVHPVIGR